MEVHVQFFVNFALLFLLYVCSSVVKGQSAILDVNVVSVLFSISPVIFSSKLESFLSCLLLPNIIYFNLSAFRVSLFVFNQLEIWSSSLFNLLCNTSEFGS